MLALEFASFWLSGFWIAGSITAPVAKSNYKSWLVTCADSDVSITIPHEFVDAAGAGVAPDNFEVQSLASHAVGSEPSWAARVDTVNLYLSKQPAVGSGGAPAIKVWAMRPHSVIE